MEKFSYKFEEYMYPLQEAIYIKAVQLAYNITNCQFSFIVIENKPPFRCKILHLSQDFIEDVEQYLQEHMHVFAKQFAIATQYNRFLGEEVC